MAQAQLTQALMGSVWGPGALSPINGRISGLDLSQSPAEQRMIREAMMATPDRMGVARDMGALSDAGIRSIGGAVLPGYHPDPSYSGFTPYEAAQAGPPAPEASVLGMPLSEGLNYAMLHGGPSAGMIKAYHGSPHDFDAFDMSKIGTGEGAQVYGHGLYFAENPEVAQSYKDTLAAKKNVKVGGTELLNPGLLGGVERQAYYTLQHAGGDVDQALRNASAAMNPSEVQAVLQRWKEAGVQKDPGKTYEVAIDAHPNDFLDWDRPLGEQAHDPGSRSIAWLPDLAEHFNDGDTGERIMQTFKEKGFSPAETAEWLREHGIRGIRYMDAGSRGKGEGTQNYVVFDDKTINILRKYGLAGLTAGLGGAASLTGAQPQQQQEAY